MQTARGLISGLLSDAQAHHRVRSDLTSTDINLVMWSIRGVVETTRNNAPDAWRRHLELLIAGMRPTDASLGHRPLTRSRVDRILAPPAFAAGPDPMGCGCR
jgi:hypothetical protein